MSETAGNREFVEYLPSDRVSYVVGLAGHVPDELTSVLGRDAGVERLTCFFNTWYPEVLGGHYLNQRLIRVLGDVLEERGFHIVDPEYFRHDGVVPTEKLEWCDALGTVYLLVDDHFRPTGRILRWEYGAGSGVELFDTSHMVDVVVEKPEVEAIVEKTRAALEGIGVTLEAAEPSQLEERPCFPTWHWFRQKLTSMAGAHRRHPGR